MDQAKSPPHLALLGGEDGIRRLVTRFYDLIAQHPLLKPLFPPDLTESREKQWAYFVEFFGGPPRYSERYGKAFLRFKHRHVKIGESEHDAWVTLLRQALAEEVDDAALIAQVEQRIAPLARAMINHNAEKKDSYYFR